MIKIKTILCAVLLFGCATKKRVQKVEVTQVDTIYVKQAIVKIPKVINETVVSNICDTVTKEVVRFKKVFVVDGDSLEILTNQNNELIIKNQRQERQLSRLDSVAKTQLFEKKEAKHKVIYKKDWWWIFGALGLGVLLGTVRPWRVFR